MMRVCLADPICDGHHSDYLMSLLQGLNEIGSVEFGLVAPAALANQVNYFDNLIAIQHAEVQYSSNFLKNESNKISFLGETSKFKAWFKPDVTHFLFSDRYFVSHWFKSVGARKLNDIIHTLHWLYFLDSFNEGRNHALKARVEFRALLNMSRRGAQIAVHSPLSAVILNKYLGVNAAFAAPYPVRIVSDASDGSSAMDVKARYGVPENSKQILLFGEVRFDRGTDLAIRAMNNVREDAHLLIVGKACHFSTRQLLSIAEKACVSNRVHIRLGYVPNAEVSALFQSSDLILLPHRKIFAGQSGPLVLAAGFGVPVVGADNRIFRETIEAYLLGRTFESEDLVSMANAINEELKLCRSVNSDNFLNDHSPITFGQSVLSAYQRAIEPR